jgi:DNA-binding cell septation regulator SpoVG
MQQPTIRVDLRLTDGKESIKAYADVTLPTPLGDITHKGFRVVQKNGEAPWVGFPNSTYIKNGKKVTRPFLEAREALLRQIADAVLAEYADQAKARASNGARE